MVEVDWDVWKGFRLVQAEEKIQKEGRVVRVWCGETRAEIKVDEHAPCARSTNM